MRYYECSMRQYDRKVRKNCVNLERRARPLSKKFRVKNIKTNIFINIKFVKYKFYNYYDIKDKLLFIIYYKSKEVI